jgi:hypothetical protein
MLLDNTEEGTDKTYKVSNEKMNHYWKRLHQVLQSELELPHQQRLINY